MARRRGQGAYADRGDGVPTPRYSGLDYGDNKAVNDQLGAAPTASSSGPAGGGAPPSSSSSRARSHQPGPMSGRDGIFGPTERPDEPLTAGVDAGPGPGRPVDAPLIPEDPNMLLRAIAEVSGHPDLLRLVGREAGA